MVEHNRGINPKSKKVEIFNVDEILKKEKGHDLLDVDPANLSLREKLRQKRQFEKMLIYKIKNTDSEEMARSFATEYLNLLPESKARNMTIDYINGSTLEEISENYEVKLNTVAKHISKIRINQLEPNLLFKAEYIRITRNNLPHLVHTNISLKTFRIAGIRYANQKHLKDYNLNKRVVDPSLQDEGYVLLGNIAAERDYEGIRKNPIFSTKIVKRFKRIYIKPEDLKAFLDQKKNYSKQSRALFPEDRDKPRSEVMKIRKLRKMSKLKDSQEES